MSIIKENFGSGGANLTPAGSSGEPSLADALRDVADDLADVAGGKADGSGIVEGILCKLPTTPSSQLTGTGNTDWNLDINPGLLEVGGLLKEEAAPTADFDIHSGSFLTGFVVGNACIAAIVAKNVAGTISFDKVVGTPAVSGSEVAPTDTEIQTAVGAGNAWAKLCETTLERTADTTVVQTVDWTLRDRSLGKGTTVVRTQKG